MPPRNGPKIQTAKINITPITMAHWSPPAGTMSFTSLV